ncbi:capsid assembly protein [Pseudomonas rubra]|uniref:Capsid assembly protein n=1 Tax=Pseudomonas rubra TaxID=2942627 RepID=A0ABT5P6F4_9PSED|nr:hypothetical protein [Pseudomonas rubra]MDD1013853.1 hypothetical protein [Pseudomonas rubra]MDD1038326.1 hypothetical protein [Pseudomonas rubra]MDD1154584.1 hypothetical protein [Pseudomonas rubra]
MQLTMLASAMGHVYQSADVYAAFGVSNAVMSSSDPVEHEQNMLALDVAARDGDASIDLVETPEEGQEEEQESSEDQQDEEQETQDDQGQPEAGDFEPLGEPDEELTKASADIEEYATGFFELRTQAIKSGLPTDVADRIESEYESDGHLSDDSYAQLAKAGYSKGFVNSFIQGQEALAQTFVAKITEYAGGKEQFDRVIAHLKANSPETVDVLFDAIERQDLKAIRSTINLGMASQVKKFGKQPARSLNRRSAAPAGPTPSQKVQGFESQNEMVKAMSDPRYGRDMKYTAEVESKVHNATW